MYINAFETYREHSMCDLAHWKGHFRIYTDAKIAQNHSKKKKCFKQKGFLFFFLNRVLK